jgi:hypothetical protein
MLTENNLESMMAGISYLNLTKTVQDAMHATIQLGFRYLWVDYLCIVQDSTPDWVHEAGVMDQIYIQSSCTIAATAAANGTQGLYFQRNPLVVKPRRIQATVNQKRRDYFIMEANFWKEEMLLSPLNERAWVFQEMVLSPRIIHFARNQILWTCQSDESCESFPFGSPKHHLGSTTPDDSRVYATIASQKRRMDLRLRDRISAPLDFWSKMLYGHEPYVHEVPRDLIVDESCDGSCDGSTVTRLSKCIIPRRYPDIRNAIWRQIVEDYSRRKLTKSEDRIVAIHGIAKEMQRHFNDDYIAGLWKTMLPIQLLWVPLDHENVQPLKSRAPSWSWLSVEGPVAGIWTGQGIPSPKVKILESLVTIEREDTRAPVYRGFIRLRGRLARGLVDKSDQSLMLSLFRQARSILAHPNEPRSLLRASRAKLVAHEPMCEEPYIVANLDFPTESEDIVEVYILQLVGHGKFYDNETPMAAGLVLEKVIDKAEWKRSGYFVVYDLKLLSDLVRAFDAFDRFPLSETLPYETQGAAKLYEITLT